MSSRRRITLFLDIRSKTKIIYSIIRTNNIHRRNKYGQIVFRFFSLSLTISTREYVYTLVARRKRTESDLQTAHVS